jgi:hypothetical protein
MIPVGWLILVVVLGVLALYLRGLIGRLDRLHLRVAAATDALDAQLLRRASAVLALAESGLLDPPSALLLVDAADQAQRAEPDRRPLAESAVSQTLRTVLEQPGLVDDVSDTPDGVGLLHDLAIACDRVALARRFANEAVRATRDVRARWVVKVLHLAGHARLPETFEMDAAPPPELSAYMDVDPYP